jgi:DNA topoisomerase-1
MSVDQSAIELYNDPVQSAKEAGFRYVTDDIPGLKREPAGKDFQYRDPSGKIVHDRKVLARIKSLAIPPAWTEVWICPDPNGHLQATGRDDRGRKQHRYHLHWREVRDETKYTKMIAFAKILPQIRGQIARDLKLPGLPRNKVLATVVRLLEVSLIRVGNDEYARENDSFGLTTMRNRHVHVNGSTLRFHFCGKSGKRHEVDIRDRRIARIVKSCQELPGQELFEYIDESGKRQDVKSGDVNDYLRELSGQDFTAKDFRTWAGTVLGALALRGLEGFESQSQAKKNITQAIASVAHRLGNTPAVCRKCYVHPDVIAAYLDGTLAKAIKKTVEEQPPLLSARLRPDEAAVLRFLQQRLKAEKAKSLPKLLKRSIATLKKRSKSVPNRVSRKAYLSPASHRPPGVCT